MLAEFVVAELDRRLAALIQPGAIAAIDYANARAQVQIGDWISAWLPWQATAGQITSWCPPTVGEQCLLLSASGMPELGFILTGFYTQSYSPVNNQPHTLAIRFPDGAQLLYDWQASTLLLESMQGITVKTPQMAIQGDVTITGKISASGDIQSSGISLQQHYHQAQGSYAKTGPPQ